MIDSPSTDAGLLSRLQKEIDTCHEYLTRAGVAEQYTVAPSGETYTMALSERILEALADEHQLHARYVEAMELVARLEGDLRVAAGLNPCPEDCCRSPVEDALEAAQANNKQLTDALRFLVRTWQYYAGSDAVGLRAFERAVESVLPLLNEKPAP